MKTLFLGDVYEYLAHDAKQYDPTAFLIDRNNYQTYLKNTPNNITAYSSLGDLPDVNSVLVNVSPALDLMHCFDKIIYRPPTKWSDASNEFVWTNQQRLLESYLLDLHFNNKEVVGLDLIDRSFADGYLKILDKRSTDKKVLWVAGGSDANGMGIEKHERFSDILSNELNLPLCDLTKIGSSIEYAADQILRSDLRKNDIVIWGLVPELRAPLADRGQVLEWTNESKFDIEILTHETRLYKSITSVNQVINFIEKVGCELIILPMMVSEHLRVFTSQYKYYCHHSLTLLDIAKNADGHPGPIHHRHLADILKNRLTQHKNSV